MSKTFSDIYNIHYPIEKLEKFHIDKAFLTRRIKGYFVIMKDGERVEVCRRIFEALEKYIKKLKNS